MSEREREREREMYSPLEPSVTSIQVSEAFSQKIAVDLPSSCASIIGTEPYSACMSKWIQRRRDDVHTRKMSRK